MNAIYPFMLFGIPAYTYAEFTTNTLSVFLFKVVEFIILYYLVTIKFKLNGNDRKIKLLKKMSTFTGPPHLRL